MKTSIVDLTAQDTALIGQIVRLLADCFDRHSPDWLPTNRHRVAEVHRSLQAGRRSRVLLGHERTVLGWIGAIEHEHVWEIHPIAVSPQVQRQGYGMMLVNDVLALARAAGAVAVWAGTSDETRSTNLSIADLYADPFTALSELRAEPDHPVNFWQKSGFSLVGVMSDEEGLGKPGITFARRVGPS